MSDQKKPTIRMPKYGKAKILKSFPSAWLTATNAYPDPRFDDEHRVREANRIIQWHRDNGSEDTLASTYRGDFYEPIKGSPEDGLYWGDFYEDPIDQMVEQEKAIALMTKQVEEANDAVKACGKALDTHYRKVKQTQYRWKTTLNKINDETREIAEWLDVNVPSSYLPVLNELITEGQSMIDDRGRPIRNRMYWDEPTIRDDVEKELMEQMSFRTVRQLIRRQDRLSAIQHQKSDISWKMQHQQEQTQKSEMNLMDHLNEAKRVRGDLAEKLDRMVSMRQALDITGLIKERNRPDKRTSIYRRTHKVGQSKR